MISSMELVVDMGGTLRLVYAEYANQVCFIEKLTSGPKRGLLGVGRRE